MISRVLALGGAKFDPKATPNDIEDDPDLCASTAADVESELTKLDRGKLFKSRYTVVSEVGKGGFGSTYECKDTTTDATVLVKEMGDKSNFINEMAALKYVSRIMASKLYVVHALDFFCEESNCYIVEEFVSDARFVTTVLEHLLAKEDYRTYCKLLQQCIETLKYMHMHGLYHLDLKPDNILVQNGAKVLKNLSGANPEVRIIDFGVAAMMCKYDSDAVKVYGTPEYSTPYSLGDRPLKENLIIRDMFALGLTFAMPFMDPVEIGHLRTVLAAWYRFAFHNPGVEPSASDIPPLKISAAARGMVYEDDLAMTNGLDNDDIALKIYFTSKYEVQPGQYPKVRPIEPHFLSIVDLLLELVRRPENNGPLSLADIERYANKDLYIKLLDKIME